VPLLKSFSKFVSIGAKVGISAGALYWTHSQGLLGSTEDSKAALDRIKKKVLPATSDYYSKVPSGSDRRQWLRDRWNNGVSKSFDGLVSFQGYLSGYKQKALGVFRA